MKKKQKQQIRDKSITELLKLIAKDQETIASVRLKGAEEKNTNKIRLMRQSVARMKTYVREKELIAEMSKIVNAESTQGGKQ